MITKLKTELNAALVIGVGLVLASGYLVTWLRFANEGIAQTGVLSALPERFYLSVAIQNLAAPVAVLLTVGIVWLVLTVRLGPDDNVPGKGYWVAFGLVLAVSAGAVALLLSPFVATSNDYWEAVLVWAAAATGLTTALGTFAHWRLDSMNAQASATQAATADSGAQLVASGTAVVLKERRDRPRELRTEGPPNERLPARAGDNHTRRSTASAPPGRAQEPAHGRNQSIQIRG